MDKKLKHIAESVVVTFAIILLFSPMTAWASTATSNQSM